MKNHLNYVYQTRLLRSMQLPLQMKKRKRGGVEALFRGEPLGELRLSKKKRCVFRFVFNRLSSWYPISLNYFASTIDGIRALLVCRFSILAQLVGHSGDSMSP